MQHTEFLERAGKVTKGIPPLITVNTTAGTASEMASFSIITDTDRRIKMAIADPHMTSDVVVNDPELMVSMPPALTSATGMDALTHAIEAYVSTLATPTTDAAAIKAIELISKYLREAVAHGEDIKTRDMMAHAEYLADPILSHPINSNNSLLPYIPYALEVDVCELLKAVSMGISLHIFKNKSYTRFQI